ncbi:site-specific DNA-methyltransferase [Hyphomonas pacifica]|uniref:site-specific DNA-methyltransferase n=1 Tax=Hyphomonas pacifica TaxID=1280941 RepID=UPI000DBF7B59|nr:site-specific DNA-methyltransferase [Hyphomonas pacifica]RAN36434.1 hypothetical protein HY11_01560 [Hyphomonas pacifica]
MEKLKMHSPNLTDENIAKIRELFPGCVAEATDENGKLRYVVDFDQLRQELSDHIVEGAQERYRLDWPGKREALITANAPIAKTLRPARDESVDFDTTQNLFIEGDNLEALKLLQQTYLGKVKMIYIDPPYNTGKDFIYRDNFAAAKEQFEVDAGERDVAEGRLVANPETRGRFHSDWLSMMYSRVRLSRSLLSDDGFLFISIGEDEFANLKKLCDEIFGEDNFVSCFIWNTEGHTDNQFDVKVNHEFILLYSKADIARLGNVVDPNTRAESNLWKGFAENSITKNGPANPPSEITLPVGFPCTTASLSLAANEPPQTFFVSASEQKYISRELTQEYEVSYPIRRDDLNVHEGKLTSAVRVFSGWANAEKLRTFIKGGCTPINEGNGNTLTFYLSDRGVIYYRREREAAKNIVSVLRNLGTTERMRSELENIGIPFSYPKPKELLSYLISMGAPDGGVVLDFFAGSGTTAQAIFEQQAKGKSLGVSFILVQLPEAIDRTDPKQVPGAKFCEGLGLPRTISEICKERIRRAGQKILEGELHPDWNRDVGFRVLKIDSSNMRDSYYTPDETSQRNLLDAVENVKPDRTDPEDLLFQVLVDWGVDLTLPIRKKEVTGKTIFFVNEEPYDLIACFEYGVTEDLVKELAKHQPARVVFRDNGFASDALKINVEQIFKQMSPATDVKSI